MQSAETLNKISQWRQKCADGSITIEEMAEAIKILREDRLAAAQTKPAKAPKVPKPPDARTQEILDALDRL